MLKRAFHTQLKALANLPTCMHTYQYIQAGDESLPTVDETAPLIGSSPSLRAPSLSRAPSLRRQLSSGPLSSKRMEHLTSNVRIERATAESWVAASEYMKFSW